MKSTQFVRNEFSGLARMNRLEPFEGSHERRAGGNAAGDRGAAILWVRMQMVRNGISYEDLIKAGCFDGGATRSHACYRNADGRTWDGQGDMPDWLKRAVNAGQSAEHFRQK
jgi:DNA-binding protein H-NS